jgi:hypothetical protein
VAADKRASAFPDVPTAAEAGVPTYIVATWYGIWAPKGTPRDAVSGMQAAMRQALPQRFVDRCRGAADERQETAARDRAALHERDRRLLQHGVGRRHPGRDLGELDHGDSGVLLHHVILK